MESLQELQRTAARFGLERVGVSPVDVPLGEEAFRAWLEAGFEGPLQYMANHAQLRSSAGNLLPGARSVIAAALNYNQDPDHQPGKPKIARYALGRDYHKVFRRKLKALARELAEAHPDAQFRVCVDSAPIFERAYAHHAGLGWFGKNTCLIDSHTGSWFVIGLLLSTVEFQPSVPAQGGCGTCRRCIEACPTGAIKQIGDRWQVDASLCISTLTIEQRGPFDHNQAVAIGDWTFGCDICQEVCPFNQPRSSQPSRAQPTAEPDFLDVRSWPSLEEIAAWDPTEWDVATQGSPVRRAGFEGIRRNAAANITNSRPDSSKIHL